MRFSNPSSNISAQKSDVGFLGLNALDIATGTVGCAVISTQIIKIFHNNMHIQSITVLFRVVYSLPQRGNLPPVLITHGLMTHIMGIGTKISAASVQFHPDFMTNTAKKLLGNFLAKIKEQKKNVKRSDCARVDGHAYYG